ncbi:MAG: TusE/DsrC/DsvC family sulfur relay protein [Gammaproteobacteria bacterium]|nr:TusE/DsrC/DsvC family sulfur relay protein [Gammaproteobacteria bacterium]
MGKIVPELCTLLKSLREKYGKKKATRRYIYDLFPYSFGQQACKIAGIRKPLRLLLDLTAVPHFFLLPFKGRRRG